jgi:hypothetical protein
MVDRILVILWMHEIAISRNKSRRARIEGAG